MLPQRLWQILFFAALAFAFVMALTPHAPQVMPSDKEDHGLAFSVLMIGAALAWPAASLLWQFAVMSGIGALIELLQLIPALHRDSDIHDWYADCVAAAGAAVLVSIIRRVRRGVPARS